MERTERFYRMIRLLRAAGTVSKGRFLEELGVSRAQFTRDMAYLRDRMDAPIAFETEAGGYRLERKDYELPGLWFNATEIYALLAMRHLLAEVEPGILGPHLDPLATRFEKLLEVADTPAKEIPKRIRLLAIANRSHALPFFEVTARAVLDRRQLKVRHFNRQNGERTDRVISPQRLVHYRDNWYVDAWCHLREGLRSFSVDAFEATEMLDAKAKKIAEGELERVLASGYGIFAGKETHRATLRFTAVRARWVSKETWHPKQKGSFDGDGRYILEVPYSDDRELLMDILKFGPDVEVLAPPALRERAARLLEDAAKLYR